MIKSLTVYQDKQLAGLKGIAVNISYIIAHLPKENCPLLEVQLLQVSILSDALTLMTKQLNQTINKE